MIIRRILLLEGEMTSWSWKYKYIDVNNQYDSFSLVKLLLDRLVSPGQTVGRHGDSFWAII